MNGFSKMLTLLLMLSLCCAIPMTGQDPICIDFENLEDGAQYGQANGLVPGDELFSAEDVKVTLEEFLYFDGSTGFINVHVSNDPFIGFPGDGLFVFPSNINLLFDFRNLDEEVTSVCFAFGDGGGEENISVNGEPILVLNDFNEAPEAIAPGVTLDVQYDPNTNFPTGTICLTGHIETLLIGGQEMAIDNVCFETQEATSDPGCMEFEDLDGPAYGGSNGTSPGQVIYTESDIPLSLFEFRNFDWTTNFHELQVLSADDFPEFSSASGQYIRLDGISSVFNFSSLSEPVEIVTLDFYYDFGPLNFSANGAPITILGTLSDGFMNIAPGVNMEINFSADNPMVGTITFTGNIFTLLIGGNALRIDNVCPDPACDIANLEISASPCDDNNQFFITLDFDYAFVSDTFALWLNGNEASFHDYDELPLVLGPFTGPINEELVFEVKDRENPDCLATAIFEPFDCHTDCEIWDMVVERTDCTPNGAYDLVLDFNHEGTNEFFHLFIGGELYENYPYEDLPIQFGPFTGSEPIHILVKDVSENCAEDINYEAPPCFDECDIRDMVAERTDCDNNGGYNIILDFIHENTGESFKLYVNGEVYETWNYGALPIQLGPFFGSEPIHLLVEDESGDCAEDLNFEAPPCFDECAIFNVIAEAHPCNADGYYLVDLEIDANNTGPLGYYVFGGGEIFGPFDYNEVFVTIGPFQGDPNDILDLYIFDIATPGCFGYYELGPISCGNEPCEIVELHVETLDCNDDGTYQLIVDFQVNNPGNDFFDLYDQNGELIGYFPIADLPITIPHFQGSGNNFDAIKVCINDQPNCCKIKEFEAPHCNTNDCHIYDVVATPQPCTPNGIFYVDIHFEFENVGNEGYKIQGNGQNYGSFSYDEPFPSIGPLTGDGTTIYEFVIIDLVNQECSNYAEIGPIDCDAPSCGIFNLVVETLDCNNDGTYGIVIDFEVENPGNDLFEVFTADGDLIDYYPIGALPVTIPHFQGSGSDFDAIKVCINDQPNCCKIIEFEAPDCSGSDCTITNLHAIPDCNDDGTFDLLIEFDVLNPGNDFFEVFNGSDEFLGFFPIAQLPITLEDYQSTAVEETIIICINDVPECCFTTEFDTPLCGDQCEIYNLQTEPLECDGLNTYSLWLNFQHANTIGNGFDVYSGDEFLGFYHYNELPVTVENFPQRLNSNYDIITICDNDNPDCCKTIEFMGLDCTGQEECHIYDVAVYPQPCNDNGVFYLEFDFAFDNVGNEGYKIVVNGEVYGEFSYNEPFPYLGPFVGDGETIYEFVVYDLQFDECSGFDVVGPIACGGNNCTITGLEAIPECNDDGSFDLLINFEVLSPDNDFFEVLSANGDYLGFFPVADLPIRLENYQSNALVENITVCMNDIPECCYTTEFATPFCGGDCSIYELEVDPQECDGLNTYSLWVNFQHENTIGDGFDVLSGDTYLGFYSYDDLPIIVEHFPQRLNSDYDIITICDNDNPNCCKTIEFMGATCNTDLCLEFLEYEDLEDAEQLATEGDSGLVIHTEYGVELTADMIYAANDPGYLQNVSISPVQTCDPEFVAAEGLRLYMEGAIRLDFSSFAIKPTILSFDYANCFGTDFVNLAINGSDPFSGFFIEAPDELNNVEIIVTPANNSGSQGSVVLFGELEDVLIGGIPLRIDNICFNGVPEDEDVWPGDGNADNIAHHFDLLNIGLGFGSEGIQRDLLSIGWEGIPAANWDTYFANGTNYKHADCNGDGVINALDKSVIVQNYGLTHGPVEDFEELPWTDLDPPIFVNFSNNDEWPSASNFEVPIVLGSNDIPVENIYGLAFTITLDPSIFNMNALAIDYSNSWLGDEGADLLTIEKFYEEEGKIEIAITRTDQINVSGEGPIARLVGIIDDIAGIRTDTKVEIRQLRAIDKEESLVWLSQPAQNVRIVNKKPKEEVSIGRIDLRRGTQIFPNPAKDQIEVQNKYNLPIDSLELLDAQGKPTGRTITDGNKLSLKGLPQGLYLLRYKVGKHIIHEKVVKM